MTAQPGLGVGIHRPQLPHPKLPTVFPRPQLPKEGGARADEHYADSRNQEYWQRQQENRYADPQINQPLHHAAAHHLQILIEFEANDAAEIARLNADALHRRHLVKGNLWNHDDVAKSDLRQDRREQPRASGRDTENAGIGEAGPGSNVGQSPNHRYAIHDFAVLARVVIEEGDGLQTYLGILRQSPQRPQSALAGA